MKLYEVYTSDGRLDASGSAEELSQKYYISPGVIRRTAYHGKKLLGEYTVVCTGTGTTPKKREKLETIARLHNKGLNTVQISEVSGIGESTVSKYIRQMKKEGVVT